jgi:hypothetical protein
MTRARDREKEKRERKKKKRRKESRENRAPNHQIKIAPKDASPSFSSSLSLFLKTILLLPDLFVRTFLSRSKRE